MPGFDYGVRLIGVGPVDVVEAGYEPFGGEETAADYGRGRGFKGLAGGSFFFEFTK